MDLNLRLLSFMFGLYLVKEKSINECNSNIQSLVLDFIPDSIILYHSSVDSDRSWIKVGCFQAVEGNQRSKNIQMCTRKYHVSVTMFHQYTGQADRHSCCFLGYSTQVSLDLTGALDEFLTSPSILLYKY